MKTITIDGKQYNMPKHWAFESQVKDNKLLILGIDILSSKAEELPEMVRLISLNSGAHIEKSRIEFNTDKKAIYFLIKLGYKKFNNENCVVWKRYDNNNNMFNLIFEHTNIEVALWDVDSNTLKMFENNFCNPL